MESDSNPSLMELLLFTFASFVVIDKIVCLDSEPDATMTNVALYKPTFQSSQSDNFSSSDLAVDDDVTTCSIAAKEKYANWSIDLGEIFPISHMKINAGGTYFGLNFELYVRTDVSHDPGTLCRLGIPNVRQEEYNISCFAGPILARTVTIKNLFSTGMILCDVQIFVCRSGLFGVGCTKQCRCNNDDVCDKLNGKCPEFCAPGWNGTDCQSVCNDGTFGPSCSKMCRCHNVTSCDKQTGECLVRCADGWVGPGCQTEIPSLSTPPSMFRAEMTQIRISWHSWIRFVDPSIALLYQIQYKLSSDVHGNHSWVDGPEVPDQDPFNEEVTVTGLQRNSFYVFRVTPLLRINANEVIKGRASPESGAFRTKCSVPETPNVTNASSWLDNSRNRPMAVIYLEWMPLTPKQSNCENILYYEIFYQKRGFDWKSLGAKMTEHAKNISSDLSFDSEYIVRVVAHNNHPYQSSSDARIVITPSAPPVPVKSANPNVAIIAGIIVFSGLILALVLALIIYRQKMRTDYQKMKRHNGLNSQEDMIERLVVYPDNVYDELVYPRHTILPGEEVPKKKPRRPKKRPPIKVEELENYIASRQDNECEELRKEYRDIPEIDNEASTNIGNKIDNRPKNRFINIIPYDHSRVVLEEKDGDPNSDYINASYIDGYKKPKAYIASQGCNKVTTQDFWQMIWEAGCHRIVMVTNLVEKGKIKCEQYWPEKFNTEKQFHDISVVLTGEEKSADFIIRTLEVSRKGEFRNIKQFHYTTWPDHGVPSRCGPIIIFRRKVRSFDESHPGVIVVHCSAGVGRTGAFIALDYLLDQAKEEGQVGIYGLTSQMRKSRGNMIQTVEQYIFVYNALLEALKYGNTNISCSDFRSKYEALCQVDPVKRKSKLEEQFDLLQSVFQNEKPDDCLLGQKSENLTKNRFPAVLPADRHRPYLMTKIPGTNDYINAVFLDSYRSRNAFILTQMPLPHTVIDLWRMIYEHKCATIVMLNLRDNQDESYGQYWPEENEECECGPFVIEILSVNNSAPNVTLRKLKLSYSPDPTRSSLAKDTGPRIINHFHLENWSSDDLLPPSPPSLVALIDLVEQSQKRTVNSPVVIHCHDGVTQSGLYATASCIWERLKDEQEVDVFQTVKNLRYYRREIIKDLTQYQFCYKMVMTYLEDFATYWNFK